MLLRQAYYWSKKIHNLTMWLMLVVGGAMMTSGVVMHRELEGEWYPTFLDASLLRYYHNKFSTVFVLILLIMMGTGLMMWVLPKIFARQRNG